MLDDTNATSTADANQDLDITDQATLEKAIELETVKAQGGTAPEPKNEPQPEEKKAEPVEDYRDRYSQLRKDYERLVKEKKDMEQSKSAEEFKTKFSSLDYDQRLEAIIDELHQTKAKYSEFETKLSDAYQSQRVEEEKAQIDSFLASDPELSNLPELHNIFKMYAMSDALVDSSLTGGEQIPWKSVKFEDIKKAVIQPILDRVGAKKITVKEKPLMGSSPKIEDDLTEEAIAKMTPSEYEKNRSKIYKKYGIKV